MVVDRAYEVDNDGMRVGLSLPDLMYSEVFANNLFLPGQTFRIQEIATINVTVDSPLGLDVNHKFFIPNQYIGSWQILQDTGQVLGGRRIFRYGGTNEPTLQGRITATEFKLSRISEHTIGDSARGNRSFSRVLLNGCNTGKSNVQIGFGGVFVTAEDYIEKSNVFDGRIYNTPPPLVDRQFFPNLGAIGLYLDLGVSFFDAFYIARVINVLDYAGDELPEYECQTRVSQDDCQLLFQQWLADNPGFFSSPVDCELQFGAPCQPFEFQISEQCGQGVVWFETPPQVPD